MKLKDVFHPLPVSVPASAGDRSIRGIHFHSAKIQPGDLFVAIRGNEVDGHDFIMDAVRAGAVAVAGEKEVPDLPVPYIRVPDGRRALAHLAARFYGQPSDRHTVVGVTGTNGKTTTSHMLHHILRENGSSCTLIGTIHHRINGVEIPAANTTPDALSLQKWLAESRDPWVVMEVSSHGIVQHRTDRIGFDCAVFTNLSREHLDYHGNMEAYFQAKKRLFSQLKPSGTAVVCTFTDWGRKLAGQLVSEGLSVRTVGETPEDDIRIEPTDRGRLDLREGGTVRTLSLPLPGKYNARNAAAAYCAATSLGVEADRAVRALEQFPGIPGRFERFSHPSGVNLVVDYAHTPDGLYEFLNTIRSRCNGQLFHVFGFRGDRDPSKRGELLSVSSRISDRVILTRDKLGKTPWNEMKEEMKRIARRYGRGKVTLVEDRSLAIRQALEEARPGDWITITGKGPEPYDDPCTLPVHSDLEAVRWLMKREHLKV
ncbi:UDP-N-acetylmuramoylalanyl-D-glutamate--2,6-diaminopimelate ligase [Melghirimyces profundicolus]|uniref:UDP-N-acetylmuramyl-tripeptide synthetase n=1 Tax=Melghirimyces profundicolus TaxID=1242148 RepID=A0A2T6BR12_9BACL|nr:UDP-N-acetylmuramoyl-L-alanyl-D-glutamate--2,6-diaminopimelate ligase [Melghirimyces profundicolus]PTX58474.1 UDP-N-acetylmuramoylalanyl-D-glutamate--2,6-diaminopimelate ligase [Melghirimyces profundicolus]